MTQDRSLKTLAAALALVTYTASVASAEQNCTAWMDQGDGTSWTTCVGDDGKQRCYKVNNTPGSTSYEVSCSE
ncbi:MAG: hypothetical protein Q8O82_00960 [Pseudorhodobacter sp.]|nr:hypothetical protein [Pseudorhodobacter sp.]